MLDKYQKEIQPGNKGWLMGDYPMWLYFSHESKVKFFDKTTTVYRVLEESASHSVDIDKEILYRKSIYDVRDFYSKKYDINIEERDENKELFYILYRKNIKKYKYIDNRNAIFIDDSFAERKSIKENCGLNVFSVDMVEVL